MIVKNEMGVLKRCFDSVVDYLDYWVICDTGSTDGTQKFIKNYFKQHKIKGQLLQHDWIDFGTNRTKAVQAARNKADYLLLMDADFIFCIKEPNFKKTKLKLDSYQIKYEGGLDYRQALFVKGKKKWKYIGVTHEYITSDPPIKTGSLDAFTFNHLADGGNRSDKFERDIRLLTKGLKDEPTNIRYMFYLAQSHKDLGHWDEAIKYYTLRAKKGGWGEEVYYSLYQLGKCMINRGDDYDKFKGYLVKAHKVRPVRLEALYTLINYCRLNNRADDGYKYGKVAINNKYPSDDLLFIEKDIHEWKFFDELALCAYYADHPFESLKIYKRIQDKLDKTRYNTNYQYFKEKYESILRYDHKIQTNQVTVILNVYKRISIFEDQLNCVLNQSIKPSDVWVCIFDSPYEDEFVTICNKYDVKIIRSNVNFKYYGRYQLGLQVETPYVCYYDDDRFPNKDNLKYYLNLVEKDEYKNTILGQWGWVLHKNHKNETTEEKTEWEFPPHYQKSRWVCSDTQSEGSIHTVDYLCGHWFMKTSVLYNLFKENNIDFSTGEDIRLSFLSYKYNQTISYCCAPFDINQRIRHNEGDVKGSTDLSSLKVRSNMIRQYIENGYLQVVCRNVSISNNNKRETKQNKICFFCPDYTSIGGSELTIKHLYDTFANDNTLITTDPNEMINFNPSVVITQQRYIQYTLDNADKYDYDIFILLHGPGQYRGYHPRCKLLIYNSESLLKLEEDYVDSSIDRLVLHPTINKSSIFSKNNNKQYISFIGSNSYNIIKGSDVFVGLAKSLPNKEFLHVSKYYPIDYKNDNYLGMKISPPTFLIDKLSKNIKVVDQTNDISGVYGKTKILVVPSVVESFGRVAVEAAINGIPVVCSDLPGLRDATFGLAYYVSDYRNANAFVEAINEIENNYDHYCDKTKEIVNLYYKAQEKSLESLSSYVLSDYDDYTEENNIDLEITDPSIDRIYSNAKNIEGEIGIVLPTYNRPEYLEITLSSLAVSNLSNCVLVMIDDNSDDDTIDIIKQFDMDIPTIKVFKNKNKNMYHSLILGWEILNKLGCTYFCNIDADVMVRPDWIGTLVSTYNLFDNKILLTGFNTTKNGHDNIDETDSYYEKLTVGGVNLFFHKDRYEEFKPIMTDRMWDYNLSYYCKNNNIKLISTKPSVVQHIGYYGLNANPDNFDYAYDFHLETEFDGHKYKFYPAIDSSGGDIEMLLTADVEEMGRICNEIPDAVGFNSNGWLKSSLKSDITEWDLYDIKTFYGTWVKD